MSVNSSSVTSYDVARVAQVSVGTVIRVLNNKPNVDEEIRTRVLQAIDELGYIYVPKKRQGVAAGGKAGVTLKSVMLCIPPMRNTQALQEIYYYTVLRGAQKVCAENDLHLMYNVVDDSVDGLEQVKSSIERGFVDGLVMINYGSHDLIEGIQQLQLPLVLVEPRIPSLFPVDTVASDDFYGGKLAVKHLLSLGHRSIACIGTTEAYVTQLRFDGYRIALNDAEIVYRPELFVHVRNDLTIDEGQWAMQQLLQRGTTFSAVFCMNDNVALGAIRVLNEKGLRVPEDISVVGFDNHEGAALSQPPLTTIEGTPAQKGMVAIQRLIDRATRPKSIVIQSVLPVHLVTRASTAAFQQNIVVI
ncbi:MAG: LacI family DNA-binding transcriptional regulator [Ktedonobacteraceae bacterium]|nr:LacI family DNA-binding transcriptional regulator [Ktedonobacteraceae bacterium]